MIVAGGRIKTLQGERDIARLRPGDRILTRDSGFQPLLSVKHIEISQAELARVPALRPIEIAPGALYSGAPERPTRVAPHHRVLVRASGPNMLCDADEVLVSAGSLLGQTGIRQMPPAPVTYIQLCFERHELVLVDGFWSESLVPETAAAARDEIAAPLPTLSELAAHPRAALPAAIETLMAS